MSRLLRSISDGFRSLNLNPRPLRRAMTDSAYAKARHWDESDEDRLAYFRIDWAEDPNPEIVDASDVFAVKWSDEDSEWVATCDRFPSLSWLAASPLEALDGLLRVMTS